MTEQELREDIMVLETRKKLYNRRIFEHGAQLQMSIERLKDTEQKLLMKQKQLDELKEEQERYPLVDDQRKCFICGQKVRKK